MKSPPTKPIGALIHTNSGTVQIYNIYRNASQNESRTEGAQVKLTHSQKVALKRVCDAEGVGMSTWISDAIRLKLQLLPHLEKIQKYKDVFKSLLDRLP